jgi:hypothetical protein
LGRYVWAVRAMPQQAYGVRIDLKKQIGTQQSG